MAFIDYGALLKVNDKFINKNQDLFMKQSSSGDIIGKIEIDEMTKDVEGNYFAIAGDKNFCLCFYKMHFIVIFNNTVIKTWYNEGFDGESFIINGVNISIKMIDPSFDLIHYDRPDEEDIKFIKNSFDKKYANKILKEKYKACNRIAYKEKHGQKFIANWEYKGNKYEVIFGYGIDPNEKKYNEIKFDSYNYSEKEIKFIDKWFND